MSKETYYFSHDYEPTSDPKIQALLGEYGGLGYGVYWRVIEMLHSDKNHKLPLKQYVFLAIAKQMLASAEQIQAIITFATTQCELFISDGENVWSKRVNDNLSRREEISEKRALAGRAGAIAKQNLAKPSKGKERKGNKKNIYTPEFLSFWSTYPKKSGSKKDAFNNWQKLNGERPAIEIILEAIRKQIEWRENANGKFRPEWKDPERWIKAKMWEVELTEENKAAW
ncbi:MAG: DUF4373 domain-containing protein [Candidatus Omnitrophica bacterium]|nr:DUF4373 domain-containing protein [Candidatus Omnitrophota bacterium]MDD5264709.1 DUF4373 domain-containing protein [Candidatus Bipolaricaulis sp.]